MRKIVLLKDYMGHLVHGLNRFSGINMDIVRSVFKDSGFEIEEYGFDEVLNRGLEINDCIVLYASTFNPEYKQYIDDALYALSKSNTLVPNYDVFKAHENKGFQEVLKRQLGISSIPAVYLSNEQDFEKYKDSIKYPSVLKTVGGAGSVGVFKISSADEARKLIKRLFRQKGYLWFMIKKYIKKYLIKSKYVEGLYNLSLYTGRIVIQEFVPDLQDDWKVLVFYDKYYALNRKVRNNDFRASGSGKLFYVEPPLEVLDFAREVFAKFDTPMASFDICVTKSGCALIEMQGIDFGPFTIINSPYYYIDNGDGWKKIDGRSDFAQEYAKSVVKYINR